MALVDFHCHLDLFSNPQAVAQAAASRNMYVLSVTTTPTAFEGTRRLAPEGSRIRTALGLHPELAAARRHELPLFRSLINKTDYIGEVGLDGSEPHRATLDVQGEVLSEILSICAIEGGKIISLHSRGASGMLLELIETEPTAGECVLHWFSAKPSMVERAASLGCWFSVGANMLASAAGRAAVKAMPRDRLLTETDGPFGSSNGRPSTPPDVENAYEMLAATLEIPRAEVNQLILSNLRVLLSSGRRRRCSL
ncbi:MAG TPA: Qat anti-phage system TatD family nuclease QatD [Pedomonas sp.]|uniref:Qat anti-phage system TatD family nuclease QatD n=1 Tax=Pedomonas sp. TaxID=2976421 RepID=UPI002F3FBF51